VSSELIIVEAPAPELHVSEEGRVILVVEPAPIPQLVVEPAPPPTVVVETNETVLVLSNLPGAKGASAYEIAVENGFVGTESQWLTSLKGFLLLESHENLSDVPADTPVGTIIYRKV
jgi:hypothetical protein